MRTALWVAVFVPFTVLALLRLPEGPRADEEDYAQYLLHAQALADGRDFRDIGFITTRYNPYIGPVATPPGLPLLLAPVVALGGADSPAIAVLGVLFGIAFLLLAARYFAGREDWRLALAVGLMSGLQPDLLHFASIPISDIPFSALVWGVLLLGERDEAWSNRRMLAITAVGALAISVRLAGIALIPAVGAYGLLHFRTHRFRPLLPLLAWLVIFGLTSTLLPTTDVLMPAVSLDPGSQFENIRFALRTYTWTVLDAQLYPLPGRFANQAYHVVALLLMSVGAVAVARRYWHSFLAMFAVAYAAMLLMVPVNNSRYFYPLIPVVVFLTLRGLVAVVRLARPAWNASRAPGIALGAALCIGAFATAVSWTPPTRSGITTLADVRALFASLRELPRTPPTRVMAIRPRILTLEVGLPAMALFRGTPEEVRRELCDKGITHVIEGDLGAFPAESSALRATIVAYPQDFGESYRNPSFVVWRFDATGASCSRAPGSPPLGAPNG